MSYQTPLVLGPSPANAQVAAAVLPAGAQTFDAPQVLSAGTEQSIPSSEGSGDSVFAGPGGVAVGYGVGGTLPWLLQVARLGTGLSFAAPQTAAEVPNPPPSIDSYSGPVVALPADGGPVAAWTVGRDASAQAESPVTGSLEVAGEQANGSFSAPEELSPPSTVSQYPVAAATTDSAIVAWGEGDSTASDSSTPFGRLEPRSARRERSAQECCATPCSPALGRMPSLPGSPGVASWWPSSRAERQSATPPRRPSARAPLLSAPWPDEAFLAELANCGIVAGPVETIGDAVRFATITDPDGSGRAVELNRRCGAMLSRSVSVPHGGGEQVLTAPKR